MLAARDAPGDDELARALGEEARAVGRRLGLQGVERQAERVLQRPT
jgi:hypothetical protein